LARAWLVTEQEAGRGEEADASGEGDGLLEPEVQVAYCGSDEILVQTVFLAAHVQVDPEEPGHVDFVGAQNVEFDVGILDGVDVKQAKEPGLVNDDDRVVVEDHLEGLVNSRKWRSGRKI
jgi:hypothetical protein